MSACDPAPHLYSMPIQFRDINRYFADEAKKVGVHSVDVSLMIERCEMRDHWHLEDMTKNREYLKHEVQILLAERYVGQFLRVSGVDFCGTCTGYPYQQLCLYLRYLFCYLDLARNLKIKRLPIR